MDPRVKSALRELVSGRDRPVLSQVVRQVAEVAEALGVPAPSRTSVYGWLDRATGHRYRISALPPAVRATLHNVDPEAEAEGRLVVFRCLNDGGLDAMSWAAAAPWWDLWQARRVRGWRPRARGLLDAILATRGIR